MNSDAVRIVLRLRDQGHQAFLVGGCVRDLLLGVTPKDYDVATDARPERIMELFEKTIPVGAQFGVVIVRVRGRNFEVATFRRDLGYSDGRRPDQVSFGGPRDDARRRDFTINGMFYDPVEDRVIDYVGGQKDLARGVVRAIGDPEARFAEDKLRLLRAVRFAARFDYSIEDKTRRAIVRRAAEIESVSAERVRDEVVHILTDGRAAAGVRLLDELGLLERVLPEIAAMKGVEQPPGHHPEGDVFVHTMIMLESMRKKYRVRPEFALAVLLHDVGKPPTFQILDRIRFNNHQNVGVDLTRTILRRLRLPTDTITTTAQLVGEHMQFINVQKMRPAKLKRFLRMDHFDLHLELHRLDCRASHGDVSNWTFCRRKLRELQDRREPLRPPRLLSGHDLIALGLKPGPLFRQVLTALEDAQLEGRVHDRDQARAWLKEYLAQKALSNIGDI